MAARRGGGDLPALFILSLNEITQQHSANLTSTYRTNTDTHTVATTTAEGRLHIIVVVITLLRDVYL